MNGAGPRFAAETESPAFASKPTRRRRFSLTRSKYSLWALPAFGLLLIAALWTRTWLQVRSIERANLQEITRETEVLVDSYEQYTRNAIEAADRMARPERTFEPNRALRAHYDEGFGRYTDLYARLRGFGQP